MLTTFSEFFEYCQQLQNLEIYTDSRKKPFKVLIDGNTISFVPSTSKKPRVANPEYTEKVLKLLAVSGDWSPSLYQGITYHSSYILGVAKHYANFQEKSGTNTTLHTNDYCHILGKDGWRKIPVTSALARPDAIVRCIECEGAIRLHVAGSGGTPRAHAEHRERHTGCSLGHYFSGVHTKHPNPVSISMAHAGELDIFLIASEDDESAFPEGTISYTTHRKLERDNQFSRRVKASRLKQFGKLECEICSFDFYEAFGELGEGFIEAHHRVPIHQLDGTQKTKAEDLALVCSNCHRMLHRSYPPLNIEALRKVVKNQQQKLIDDLTENPL